MKLRDIFVSYKIAKKSDKFYLSFLSHLGYCGLCLPRFLRKFFARSCFHKAWFGGYTGLAFLSIQELTSPPIDFYDGYIHEEPTKRDSNEFYIAKNIVQTESRDRLNVIYDVNSLKILSVHNSLNEWDETLASYYSDKPDDYPTDRKLMNVFVPFGTNIDQDVIGSSIKFWEQDFELFKEAKEALKQFASNTNSEYESEMTSCSLWYEDDIIWTTNPYGEDGAISIRSGLDDLELFQSIYSFFSRWYEPRCEQGILLV